MGVIADALDQNLRVHIFQIIAIITAFAINDCMLNRRGSRWPLAAYLCFRMGVLSLLFDDILLVPYGTTTWYLCANIAVRALNVLFLCLSFLMIYEDSLMKIIVVLMIAELPPSTTNMLCTVVLNLLEKNDNLFAATGRTDWTTFVVAALNIVLNLLILYCGKFFFCKMRKYEMTNRFSLLLFSFYVALSLWSNVAISVQTDPEKSARVLHTFLICLVFSAVFMILFMHYQKYIRRKHTYLVEKKNLIKSNYYAVQNQIIQMEKQRNDIEEQVHQIQKMDIESTDDKTIEEYLQKLTKQYQSISRGIYCENQLMDALLGEFVRKCHREQIKIRVLFHGFRRGTIEEDDLFELLNGLFEEILRLKVSSITVQAMTVRNQLTLRLEWDKGNLYKKNHMNHLRKYHGVWKQTEADGHMQLMILLDTGESESWM